MRMRGKQNSSRREFGLSADERRRFGATSQKKSRLRKPLDAPLVTSDASTCCSIAPAITRESNFLDFSEESFNQCIDRGPKAYFLACQAVGRQMVEQRFGKIINLSTTDARIASAEATGNSAAYSSIDAMTRAIAQGLGFYGINVNSLVHGPMDNISVTPEEAGERLRRIPLGRLGKPEDLVGAAIFLASDDSNFVCGESLYVDAGYSNAAVTEDSFRPEWGRTWGTFEVPPRNK